MSREFGNQDVAITALIGMSVWELTKAYRSACPPLTELRDAHGADKLRVTQDLIDADVTVGLVSFVAAIGAAWLMRSWIPALMILGTYVVLAGYSHSILSDRPVGRNIEGSK